MMRTYDIAVIGAGVVGTAIARRLAATRCSVAILDARDDVTEGTSKANTAILHTGYDAKPGTLEGRLVARGYRLTWQYCRQAGIGVRRTGAVLVAWDEEQAASLPALQAKAVQNGYEKTRIITPEQVYAELPHLGPGVTGGLTVPDESIIDAWSVPLGFATDAVNRGAALLREHRVEGIEVGADVTRIRTSAGALKARWVVNAAGLGSDAIDAMYGYDRLRVNPRRGELLVFDKLASGLAPKIVLAAPSKVGKGVLISPTIFGNVMLGPTAEDMEDKTDTATTEAGFAFLLEKGERIVPELLDEEVTASYAGLRAANNQSDYLIEVDRPQRYVIASAIRSTGLTSAIAVAEHIAELMDAANSGLDMTERADLPPVARMAPLGEHQLRPYRDGERIAADPEYGTMVCFCERVTRGEIRDAMSSIIPPCSLSGLRRRTRAMNGRCQGFFCGAEVQRLLDEYASATGPKEEINA
ncbi:NAD(P)/FAD-dependent oxidoreductase [Actinomyces israelii]|uniref:NAD(P)/FAD-dependent oxidoreductase n=1 Tax=Actinomyces israelii TaxID=1659 RepID=UPI0025545582|nr:NAD(P)/FAD-dependent oxidoreductase [Actinomyces israelii]WKR21580.1 L-2-hydroxyglutarate dehydrogenase [Actinomyces israelii]